MIRLEESMGSLLISSVGSIDIPGRPFVSGAKYEASRVPSGDISKDIDLRRMALGTRGTVPDVESKQPGHRAKSAALPLLAGRPLSQAHGSDYGSAAILYRAEPGWISRKDSAVMDVPSCSAISRRSSGLPRACSLSSRSSPSKAERAIDG